MRISSRRYLLSLVVVGIAAYFWLNYDKSTGEKIVDSAKTVCVGRFLVDLPSDIEVSYGQTQIAGWHISTVEHLPDEQYTREVEAREEELRGQKNEHDLPSLEMAIPFHYPTARGTVFVFNREWNHYFSNGQRIDINSVTVEAKIRLDDATLLFKAESVQIEDARALAELAQQIRYRRADEMPSEPGFCIENAFIEDPIPPLFTEFTVMFAGYRSRPDLAIVLSTAAHITESKTLLQRNAENDIVQRYRWHFHEIFGGRRDINGIQGEEVSFRARERNGTKGHSYTWESFTTKGDPMRPSLVLELGTGYGRAGEAVDSSLSDRDVQALWDRISSTVRPRPVKAAVPHVAIAKPAGRAQAGTPCPASGWWTCAESVAGHDVAGGTSRHFEQGVQMPQAQLLAPASVLHRLKGERPTFTLGTPTVWTLVKEKP